ncbi:hypothetical protein CI102_12390 [Trichoderma harzianum]|nr:hypothetical protein CI102_12390 [Trichoderma harzianum]
MYLPRYYMLFCEMADGEKCGVDPRICTNPRLARVACSPVGWPATGSANRHRPMQDLEWQVPDWLFDEMGLAGDWKSESLFRSLVSGGSREVDKEPNSAIQVFVIIEGINNTLKRSFLSVQFILLILRVLYHHKANGLTHLVQGSKSRCYLWQYWEYEYARRV